MPSSKRRAAGRVGWTGSKTIETIVDPLSGSAFAPSRARIVENGLPESLALMFAYVGSFTTKKRNAHGEGIKVYRVDASGHWALVQLVSGLVNPSFLTVSSDRSTLYSVHADRTDVTAFSIDGESGRLSRLNVRSTEGKNPVHPAIDPSGRFLVTANYAAGTVTVLSLAHDGSLGANQRLSWP